VAIFLCFSACNLLSRKGDRQRLNGGRSAISCRLPRFKMETDADLVGSLAELGITAPFAQIPGEFSDICGDPQVTHPLLAYVFRVKVDSNLVSNDWAWARERFPPSSEGWKKKKKKKRASPLSRYISTYGIRMIACISCTWGRIIQYIFTVLLHGTSGIRNVRIRLDVLFTRKRTITSVCGISHMHSHATHASPLCFRSSTSTA